MKPKCQDIGMPIAERQLEGAENDKMCTVRVKLGKPFPDETDEAYWYCLYSIEVGSTQRIFYGAGVDSPQALRIAIFMIKTEIKNKYAHLNLKWMGESDLGFSGQL
jgi:Domain of unknown function (DUF6968)